MASFSCKYKTAAEIEALDFIECMEVLEENEIPYEGTEDIEDLKKTIINHLPKLDERTVSETETNPDASTVSEMEEKSDAKTFRELEATPDECTEAVDQDLPKLDDNAASEMNKNSDKISANKVTKLEEKIDETAISEMEAKLDTSTVSEMEAKCDDNVVSEMEADPDENDVSEMEAKLDESTGSEMEPIRDDNVVSEMEADPDENIVSEMEAKPSDDNTVCEMEESQGADTKKPSMLSRLEGPLVIGEPPSPELMEEDDDEFLHRTKTSISGKTEQPRLTKTLGVPLKELVKKAPHGSAVTKTFGVPLEDLVKRAPPGSTVPTFVCKVLDYINSRGYIEQLFIRDGQKNVVEKLKNRFDADGDADFEFEQETDILAVGQLLKVFLYELPKPIFPTEVIPDLEKPTDDDAEVGGAYHLTKAMLVLPDTHWHLLKFLTQSLQRIIMPGQPLSGMAAAIVPSLTRPHVSARSRNGSILTRVVVSCIVNTYDIFDEDKETTRELLEKSERSQMALQIEHMAYKRGRFRRLPSSKTSQQQVKSTVQEPSDSSISTPGTSGSSIPTPGPSESDIPTPGPSGSGIPTPGPSGSSIPTPGPSESGIPTPGPSGSGIPTPGPSGSGIPTPGPSGSGIPTPGPSGSGIPTPGPSGSGIPTPNITEGDDNDHSGTGKGLLSELWNFLRDGTSAEFKKMIETPEYTIPKRKTTETYHDVIIVDDQEVIIENIQSDDEVEVLQYEAGGRKTPAQQESSVPRFGLQQEAATEDALTIVDGASTLTPGSTKDIDRFEAHSAPIDLTKSSTPMVDIPYSGQFSHTSTVPIDLTKTALQSDARVYSDSSEDMACDVIISQTLPGDVEITGVEPAPISGVSVAVSGNVSQTAVGPDDISQTVTGLGGPPQSVAAPDHVSQNMAGPDDVSETVTVPGDMTQTAVGPDDVSQTVVGPDDVSQTLAGPDDVSQTVLGIGGASLSVRSADQVNATAPGVTDNKQIHKTGDTEEADMDLDPEGTDKLPISELMELMTTPKRWKLVILYLDPIEIYDSLCIKKVITEREYFSTFKGCATKQDRIEKLKGGMEKNSIYVEEVITFIQNSRRTLLMKKILKADDATLKKMLEEQDPSDLLAKLRGGRLKRHRSRLLPFPAIKPTEQVTKETDLRRNVPDKPGDAGRASDDMVDWETGSYDVVKFTEAVQGGVDLGGYAALFQNKDFELERFPVNPLLIVATFGSSEAITYVHQLSSIFFNWNELLEIKTGVFEGILDDMKDRNATALYVATFMEKLETVGTLIKYADERNIVYCMNNIQLSISMEKVYMTEVGERLKREYSALKPAVVPGHQKESDGTSGRVFIVYSPDVLRATNHEKEGIGLVMVRNPYKVDREAVTVSDSKDADSDISRQDMERTKQAIASHSKTLWCNHSNLNIISVCSVRSKRKGAILEKSLCVVLYCSTKGVVPLGEEEFPTRLNFGDADSIGIDVREGYFEYGYNSQPSINRHEMLKMGCNIGEMTTRVKNGGGTLGPFVKYNGIMSFLTCAHVLFDVGSFCKKVDFTDTGSPRVRVVQPAADASCPSGTPCGFVQRAIFDPNLDTSIDVAVVTISDPARRPTKGRFAIDHSYKYTTAGFKELPEYNNGSVYLDIATFGGSNMVVQFGSETHLTKGSLTVNGTQVRPLSTALGLPSGADKVCMTNQYEVEGIKSRINFFLPGDSGSAVFMMYGTSLHCIGMAIGSMSNGNAVVTPIGALLNALGGPQCSIELAKFEDSSQQPCTSRIKRRYTKIDLKRQRFKSMKKK